MHPGRRVNWYGDDTQRSRAIALLNALLGNWGRKGGLFVQAGIKVPAYPLPKYPKSDKPLADNPNGERYPFADEAVTTGIREATLSGKPYPIKGWFVYSTNIMNALPNEAETLKAIEALDLLVVIDTMPSEIAGYADVVLPEVVFLERYDELLVGWGRRGWMSLRQPVVAPPDEQKPGWWIAKQLAGKLGIPECMPFKDMEEYLAVSRRERRLQLGQAEDRGRDHGRKEADHGRGRSRTAFDTPSGKVEFWSEQLAKKGFDPVPKYTKHAEPPAGYFRLITGRAPVHTFSRTQSNPLLDRPDARKRDLGQRGNRREARPEERPVREAQEPGRRRVQPHQGEGHAAHPPRHRLHGLRLRPAQHDGQGAPTRRAPAPRSSTTKYETDPADGRHQHPRELRHLREGGLRWHASEW